MTTVTGFEIEDGIGTWVWDGERVYLSEAEGLVEDNGYPAETLDDAFVILFENGLLGQNAIVKTHEENLP